jgi:hypothetical protein
MRASCSDDDSFTGLVRMTAWQSSAAEGGSPSSTRLAHSVARMCSCARHPLRSHSSRQVCSLSQNSPDILYVQAHLRAPPIHS